MNALTAIARCSVYFIQNDRSGHVKIGFSSNVRARLGGLQTSQVDPLSLIRVIDGGPATERWLHRRFAHLAIRGEWFAFDSDMLSVVPPDEVVTPIAVIPSRRFSARVLESAFGAPARKRISKNPPRDGGCLEG